MSNLLLLLSWMTECDLSQRMVILSILISDWRNVALTKWTGTVKYCRMGATTLSIATFSITIKIATLSITALNTIVLNVANKLILLSVVAPQNQLTAITKQLFTHKLCWTQIWQELLSTLVFKLSRGVWKPTKNNKKFLGNVFNSMKGKFAYDTCRVYNSVQASHVSQSLSKEYLRGKYHFTIDLLFGL